MSIADRIWLGWDHKIHSFGDGLTGQPTPDLQEQQERDALADAAFRGSATLKGPAVPQAVASDAACQRARAWSRRRANKLRREVKQMEASSMSSELQDLVLTLSSHAIKADQTEYDLWQHEIAEAIDLERAVAAFRVDQSTLATILQEFTI